MQLSYSRLSCFQRCKRRYFWQYLEGYSPLERSIGQTAGDAGHRALAHWYMAGKDADSAVRIAREVLADNQKKADELEAVLRRYFAWATAADDFEMLAVEQEFRLPLGPEHTLYGIVDGVARRHDNTAWLIEHKFNKQASTSHLALDRQCSIYLSAFAADTKLGRPADPRLQGLSLAGATYNVVRMAGGATAQREPALRDYVFRSQYAIELTRRELLCIANDISHYESLSSNDLLRASYANPNDRCHWDCAFYLTCIGMYDSGDVSALQSQFVKRGEDRKAKTRSWELDN